MKKRLYLRTLKFACVLWAALLLGTGVLQAQTAKKITGVVTTAAGEPIAGAVVTVKQTKKSVITDVAGKFSTLALPKQTLVVDVVGFEKKEIEVGDETVLVIALAQSSNSLNDVVVMGYTKQSRRDITGAVSTISADVIANTPVTDVTSLLQGHIAGVSVDGQGGPGSEQVIRIRGFGTLGDNNPLYVIDGVQTNTGLNLINQNDIETITVLKDAASCALYGAKGSSGVIVITTKRGKIGAPKLEYNSYVGYESPRKFPSIITPQQQADAVWGYFKNSGQTPTSTLYGSGATPVLPDYVIERQLGSGLVVQAGDPAADPSLYNYSTYRILQLNKSGTDWFREVFKPAVTQNHELALSGATDKANYALTFGYTSDNGILLYSYFKRYSLRVNTEFKPTSWLKFGENMQFAYSTGNSVTDHTDQNVVAELYQTSRLFPVYDIGGNLAGDKGATALGLGGNPVTSRVTSQNYKGYSARMLGSAFAEVEPVKGLVFQTTLGMDYTPYDSYAFQDTLPQETYSSAFNTFYESSGYSLELRTTNKLSYDFSFGKNRFSAFVAYEASEANSRIVGGTDDSLPFTTPGFQIFGTGRRNFLMPYGGVGKSTYVSEFGNINYSYDDKYLATVTLRRDGSAKFGPKKKYGLFPSGSLGWRVSSEEFMKNVTWVKDFKIRASVGTSGNEATLGTDEIYDLYYTDPSYTYYDLAGSNNSALLGFALTQRGDSSLQWEVNQTTNIGFDATFFNKTPLTVSFNWFNRITNRLLYQPPATVLSGDAAAPFQNIMNFTNKGVELELDYKHPNKGGLGYDMNFNIATYRNNVVYIDGDPATFILGGSYAREVNLSRSVVGRPISSFYGYVYEGIFQSGSEVTKHAKEDGVTAANGAGHFKFKDLNNDGVINDEDRTFIGSPHPKFTYGYNLNLYYKNFDLGVFLQGVVGNKIFNYWRISSAWPGELGSGSLDTWTPQNKGAKLPIWDASGIQDNTPSSFFVEDGSYLRVKSIQLGYNVTGLKHISKLRFYVQAYNIFTITKYSGMDPEVNDGSPDNVGIDYGGFYPVSKKFIFGVNLGL